VKNNNEGEDILGNLLFPKGLFDDRSIKHYTQVIPVNLHHFYITGELEEDMDIYAEMLNTIKTAEAHDKIYLYLNSYGGVLTTALQIISTISQSVAEVITVIEGEVCSAATFIFLAGDKYIVNDNTIFMIHNYSHGSHGKGGEVASHVTFTQEHFRELAFYYYRDILTDKEIESVCDDKDIWLTSEKLLKRLKKKNSNKIIDTIGDYEME
jgi:ATP-dependent protease ClpP protease subunit